jgi:hypothetical protein
MVTKKLNALGVFEYLELFDKDGNRVYEFKPDSDDGYWTKLTYDSNGNQLTSETSDGYWYKRTYDSDGNRLTHEDSDGYWYKRTYDSKGNELTYENSTGYWYKRTYYSKGNRLTFEDSNGEKRGFGIPEFPMKEFVETVGHDFKIKKQNNGK